MGCFGAARGGVAGAGRLAEEGPRAEGIGIVVLRMYIVVGWIGKEDWGGMSGKEMEIGDWRLEIGMAVSYGWKGWVIFGEKEEG